jgi:hypothetical protein
MNPTKSAVVVSVPAWVKPDQPIRSSLFEVACLVGVEDQWIRMSADDQRAVMGFPVFGKQAFMVREDGVVEVARSTCFGTTYELAEYSATKIFAAASQCKRLSPGTFGPAYA